MPSICFYLHPYFWPKGEIPSSADEPWPGFGFGPYAWTIQTWLRLQAAGVPCHLSSTAPNAGILVAHRESLAAIDGHFQERVLPRKQLFVVDISADLRPYPPANLHVVQNRRQAALYTDHFYVNHWPQPGLIPRAADRGDRFKNVAFLGNAKNLDPGLQSDDWTRRLAALGLRWIQRDQTFNHQDASSYRSTTGWEDFSSVDAVVAVRRFTRSARGGFDHKPATKLFNAWLAGVPAILGRESAYQWERRAEDDYLEANSPSEIVAMLERLRKDVRLRQRMVARGRIRSREIDPAATTQQWIEMLESVIIPRHERWRRLPRTAQLADGIRRRTALQFGRIRARAGLVLGH